MAPRIINLDSRWRCLISFMPRPLHPRYHWIGGWTGPRTDVDIVLFLFTAYKIVQEVGAVCFTRYDIKEIY